MIARDEYSKYRRNSKYLDFTERMLNNLDTWEEAITAEKAGDLGGLSVFFNTLGKVCLRVALEKQHDCVEACLKI